MNALLIAILDGAAPAAGQGQTGAGGGWEMLIMMVALFAIIYFFMIRPQNKKQKEIQKFRDALQVGQEVITIGGLHGTIKKIDGSKITLKVATGVEVDFEKSAIMPGGTPVAQQQTQQ